MFFSGKNSPNLKTNRDLLMSPNMEHADFAIFSQRLELRFPAHIIEC